MQRLAVLRYCRDILAERQKSDTWDGWFWGIRRKIIDYWIAILERDSDSANSIAELNLEERQVVRRSHPLLASRACSPGGVLQLNRDWQKALELRAQRYVAALKAHR
jgi:hypothetical protein